MSKFQQGANGPSRRPNQVFGLVRASNPRSPRNQGRKSVLTTSPSGTDSEQLVSYRNAHTNLSVR